MEKFFFKVDITTHEIIGTIVNLGEAHFNGNDVLWIKVKNGERYSDYILSKQVAQSLGSSLAKGKKITINELGNSIKKGGQLEKL